jgi:hypothetical protein
MALPIAIFQGLAAKKKQKKLNKLIDNRPKYKIADEAYDNQAIAKAEAYGRDRAIQGQEQELEQDAANAVADVKDVTSGTSGLLSTIAAINANKDQSRRGLAQQEAQLMAQKKGQLLDVNNQMIDEKDKAWNYNENMPYQMKVAALRDRIKFNQEQAAQQYAASSNFMTNMFAGGSFNYQQPNSGQTQTQDGGGGSVAGGGPTYGGSGGGQSGGGGMMKGMGQMGGMGMAFSDERLKKSIEVSEYGIAEVMKLHPVKFEYNWNREKHVGFIAQNVQNIIPEAVVVDEDTPHEYLKIRMEELVPVLVKAVQELQAQIQSLEKQVEELKVVA